MTLIAKNADEFRENRSAAWLEVFAAAAKAVPERTVDPSMGQQYCCSLFDQQQRDFFHAVNWPAHHIAENVRTATGVLVRRRRSGSADEISACGEALSAANAAFAKAAPGIRAKIEALQRQLSGLQAAVDAASADYKHRCEQRNIMRQRLPEHLKDVSDAELDAMLAPFLK